MFIENEFVIDKSSVEAENMLLVRCTCLAVYSCQWQFEVMIVIFVILYNSCGIKFIKLTLYGT